MVTRKMVDIEVFETSGVDHPAHLHEGWAVMKSATQDEVDALFEKATLTGSGMDDLPDSAFAYIEPGGSKDGGGKTVPRSKRHFPIQDAAHVRNALSRASQSPFGDKAMPKINAAAKKFGIGVNKSKEEQEMADNETPTFTQEDVDKAVAKALEAHEATLAAVTKERDEAVAKAAAGEETGGAGEDIMKSVPEAVRKMFEAQNEAIAKAEARAEADRRAFEKERDDRLDERAVTVSRETFKSLAFNHEEVAPALRRLEAANPEVAKSVMSVLKAAEGQLESAGIFAELGKAGDGSEGGTAIDKINAIAKSIQETDPKMNASVAFSKAVDANPTLYTEYLQGK